MNNLLIMNTTTVLEIRKQINMKFPKPHVEVMSYFHFSTPVNSVLPVSTHLRSACRE